MSMSRRVWAWAAGDARGRRGGTLAAAGTRRTLLTPEQFAACGTGGLGAFARRHPMQPPPLPFSLPGPREWTVDLSGVEYPTAACLGRLVALNS